MTDHDLRNIDSSLNEIVDMIRKEDDTEKRATLLIMRDLASILSGIAGSFNDMKREHYQKIDEHEIRINDHEALIGQHQKIVTQGETSLKWLRWLVLSIQPILIGTIIYAYTLIADLRDSVNEQSAVLPRIEARLNDLTPDRKPY